MDIEKAKEKLSEITERCDSLDNDALEADKVHCHALEIRTKTHQALSLLDEPPACQPPEGSEFTKALRGIATHPYPCCGYEECDTADMALEACDRLDAMEAEKKELEKENAAYKKCGKDICHYCTNGGIRAYPRVLCSACGHLAIESPEGKLLTNEFYAIDKLRNLESQLAKYKEVVKYLWNLQVMGGQPEALKETFKRNLKRILGEKEFKELKKDG